MIVMEFSRETYLNRLINKKNNSLIKVITGARRCGKSYLMNTLFYRFLISSGVPEKNIIRFAFDNDEDLDLLDPFYPERPAKILQNNGLYTIDSRKFRAYIKSVTDENETYYLLLDEIQMLDSFVGTLNAFLTHKNFDVYVTGSNSQMLSSEVDTKFRGRKSSLHMLPLSFSEFTDGMNCIPEEAWKQYIVTGGIPILYSLSPDERTQYLYELCNEVYLKDILGRNNIKDADTLSELFTVLASCVGAGVSPSSLERTFRSKRNVMVTDDTINRYISCFEDAFIVSKAKKYNIKGKALIDSPYKVYFEDVGVRNAALNFRQIEETHLMENIIYNELRYRGFNVTVGEVNVNEITDNRDKNGNRIYRRKKLEIDFIAERAEEKYYIQSCLSLKDLDTKEREIRPFSSLNDSFKKIIVTKDGLSIRTNENGFMIVDVFDFLLHPEKLLNCG